MILPKTFEITFPKRCSLHNNILCWFEINSNCTVTIVSKKLTFQTMNLRDHNNKLKVIVSFKRQDKNLVGWEK